MQGLTIDPASQTAASILAEVRSLQGAYESATRTLDAITGHMLSADNATLAAFGNLIGPAEMEGLKTLHLMHGTTINQLAESAESVLAKASGRDPVKPLLVDVRPLEIKLAEQYRAITFNGEDFGVVDMERPPEPEQPTEPALEV